MVRQTIGHQVLLGHAEVRGESDMILGVQILLVGKREDAPHVLYY